MTLVFHLRWNVWLRDNWSDPYPDFRDLTLL